MGANADKELSSKEVYWRLLGYVRPYRWAFIVAVCCMIVSSSLEPALPALLKFILDDGFAQNQDSLDWVFYPSLVFAIFLVRAIVGLIADYAMTWVSQHVIADLRKRMFDGLLRLPNSYFADNLSGRLISRVTSDVIACSWSRPKYIIDPLAKTVTPINQQNESTRANNPSRQLTVLEDLASQLDDLRRYSRPDRLELNEEIKELETKISETISKWTPP